MIRDWKSLTSNAKKVCIADFFWNLGRTLPHAILTVFLIYQGCTLIQIAILQSVFMIVVTLTEFPSGVLSDMFSRKNVYLLSLITLFISYLLIGFYSYNFIMLCISYVLYGLSVSLKSGTLEAEVVLELSNAQKSIKEYSILSSYIMSVSAIVGGLIGSILYSWINQKIYIISLILFIFSFISATLCSFSQDRKETKERRSTLVLEISKGLCIINKSQILKYILCLFAVSTLFIQPFFQYWQILYQNNNVSNQYFGVIYIIFQICNIIGTSLYKRMKIERFSVIIILLIIPVIYGIGILFERGTLVSLPLSVIIFFIYTMHLNVIQKQFAPKEHISSFFSLVGTIENLISIGSLFIMAKFMNVIGVELAYLVLFVIFTIFTVILQERLEILIKSKNINKDIEVEAKKENKYL